MTQVNPKKVMKTENVQNSGENVQFKKTLCQKC